jgi:hypothetical protein
LFRITAIVSAIVFLALFGLLLVDGRLYVATYGVPQDAGADFLARRAAPLFLGLAVILWMLRDLPVGATRDALCLGMVPLWFGIAATGVYEYATGQASAAVLVAAAAAILIGGVFLVARRR